MSHNPIPLDRCTLLYTRLPFKGREPISWHYHTSDARPMVRPVPNCTAWWQRHDLLWIAVRKRGGRGSNPRPVGRKSGAVTPPNHSVALLRLVNNGLFIDWSTFAPAFVNFRRQSNPMLLNLSSARRKVMICYLFGRSNQTVQAFYPISRTQNSQFAQ